MSKISSYAFHATNADIIIIGIANINGSKINDISAQIIATVKVAICFFADHQNPIEESCELVVSSFFIFFIKKYYCSCALVFYEFMAKIE